MKCTNISKKLKASLMLPLTEQLEEEIKYKHVNSTITQKRAWWYFVFPHSSPGALWTQNLSGFDVILSEPSISLQKADK